MELAEVWNWRTGTSQLKDMAARSLLLKLEQRGMITLPPRRQKATRRSPIATVALDNELPPVANAVPIARAAGARIVIMNAEPTQFDAIADAVLNGSISVELPQVCGIAER